MPGEDEVQGASGEVPRGREPWYRRWSTWAIGALAGVVVAGAIAGGLVATSGTDRTGTASPTGSTAPAATSAVSVALSTASTTEQGANAIYHAVMERFGDVQPFSSVSDAEDQHIATLAQLATRYGVALPSGPFTGASAPATLADACQVGVNTEQNIVAMYTQLLSDVSGHADLTRAFSNLQAAARDSHLPAFQRCVSGTTTTPSTTSTATSAVSAALSTASTAEQEALATYHAVVETFGDVRPFTSATDAEDQHVSTLASLAARYAVTLPTGPFTGQAPPATLTAACQVGVGIEQTMVAMYAQLLPQVSAYSDLTQELTSLQASARDNLLPAFQRCA